MTIIHKFIFRYIKENDLYDIFLYHSNDNNWTEYWNVLKNDFLSVNFTSHIKYQLKWDEEIRFKYNLTKFAISNDRIRKICDLDEFYNNKRRLTFDNVAIKCKSKNEYDSIKQFCHQNGIYVSDKYNKLDKYYYLSIGRNGALLKSSSSFPLFTKPKHVISLNNFKIKYNIFKLSFFLKQFSFKEKIKLLLKLK